MRIVKNLFLFTLFVALIPTLGMAEIRMVSDIIVEMGKSRGIIHESDDVRDALALAKKNHNAIRGILHKIDEWFVIEIKMGEHRTDDNKTIIKSYNLYNIIPKPWPFVPSEKHFGSYIHREVFLNGSATFVMTHRKKENYKETGYSVYTDRAIYNFAVTDINLAE